MLLLLELLLPELLLPELLLLLEELDLEDEDELDFEPLLEEEPWLVAFPTAASTTFDRVKVHKTRQARQIITILLYFFKEITKPTPLQEFPRFLHKGHYFLRLRRLVVGVPAHSRFRSRCLQTPDHTGVRVAPTIYQIITCISTSRQSVRAAGLPVVRRLQANQCPFSPGQVFAFRAKYSDIFVAIDNYCR